MTPVVIGDATLYCADCRDVLPTLGRFDLLLTDPPYGIGAASSKFVNGTNRARPDGLDWDARPVEDDLLRACLQLAADAIVWGGNYFALGASRCWLIWDKCTGENSYADAELAWTSLDQVVRLRRLAWVGANAKDTAVRVHPTQKPIELMAWCLRHPPKAATVLDPFMGSGTTGVACAQLGRKFTGIEREPKYFDIACKRIEQAYAQGRLFEPEQAKPQQGALL